MYMAMYMGLCVTGGYVSGHVCVCTVEPRISGPHISGLNSPVHAHAISSTSTAPVAMPISAARLEVSGLYIPAVTRL
jgi:hypothetical protein